MAAGASNVRGRKSPLVGIGPIATTGRDSTLFQVPAVTTPAVTTPLEGLLAGLRLGLGTGAGDPEADREALSLVADWSTVATLAQRHRVAPLLLQGMRAGGPVSGIEPKLERICERNLCNGLARIAALKRATGLLAAADVPCLVLKGLSLGRHFYRHPLARYAEDVDLLVSPRTFRAAERVLLENGWRRIKPDFRETPARNRWYDRFRKEHLLTGPGGMLDLHQRLSHNPFYFDAPFESLHARSVPVEIGALSFRALGPEDEFTYLMCHGAMHYWKRLKWLCDVAALLASMEPALFARVSARCRRDGLESVLASTLLLCREAFHVRPPRDAAALPAGGRRAAWVARFSRRTWSDEDATRSSGGFDWAGQKFIGLVTRPDPKAVLHEVASVFVGPRDWERLDLPDRWFYLYFPLRPLLWLTRRKGGRKRTDTKEAAGEVPPSDPPDGERLPLPADPEGRRTEAGGRGTGDERGSSAGAPGRSAPPAAKAGMGLRLRTAAKAVRTFARAPVATKAMAFEAALFLLLARLLVKYVPMRHWRRRLVTAEEPAPAGALPADPQAAFSAGGPEEPESAGGLRPSGPRRWSPRRLAHVVRTVARHVPFPAVCLPQAMALQWMLRRRGVKSRLIIGARRKADGMGLDFHAWLTVGGRCVIGGGEVDTYVALPPFDGIGSQPG